MNSRDFFEASPRRWRLGILLIALFLPILARAQLVADGQTNVLSGVVSNIDEAVIIGTNGSFTLLVVTNGSVLSNTTGGITIGSNYSARCNRLIVTGSQWLGSPKVTVGKNGSGSELDILDGGQITSSGGNIIGADANTNLVVVSGSGSTWGLDILGQGGSFNTLIVSNGGQVFSDPPIGFGTEVAAAFPSSNNTAIVTGPGSLWQNNYFSLGNQGNSNQLIVTDSGTFAASVLVVGNQEYFATKYNQLTVSNSGIVYISNYLSIGELNSTVPNAVLIDGGTVVVAGTNGTALFSGCTLTLNSGLFETGFLQNGFGAQIIFNGGTLQCGAIATGITPFVVGDGTDAALYTMLGGSNHFNRGMVISSNALLNGSGTIFTNNVSVNNGGTIAPGTNNNLGSFVIYGSLTLNPGSTTSMKLNASDTAADTLTGMSNLVYGGTLQLTNISGSYSAGQSFSLFSATSYSGTFTALIPASPGPGLRWDTNELSVDGVLRVFSTTTPPPSFSSATAANGSLLIGASGGIPYDPCYLLASTNLSAPLSNWSSVTTNFFDSTGATTFTNGIPADPPQQFFLLQVN